MNADDIKGVGAGTILRRKADGSLESATDEVAVEEPLEIRIDNQSVAVTMRTPGHDEELAAGFLLSEGIVHRRGDLREIAARVQPGSFDNIINVALSPEINFDSEVVRRFGTISSSCGLCGKTSLEFIRRQFPPLPQKDTRVLEVETAAANAGKTPPRTEEFRPHRRHSRRRHLCKKRESYDFA